MKNILIILLITMMLLSLPYSAEADTEEFYLEELFDKHRSFVLAVDIKHFSVVCDMTFQKQLKKQLRISNQTLLIVNSTFLLFMLVAILMLIRSLKNQNEIQSVLKKEKEKYQLLFENMREGLVYNDVVYDDTGKLVNLLLLDVNSAYERIIGLRRDEIVNRTVTEIFPQFEYYWLECCREVILTGRSMQIDNYFQAPCRYLSVNIFEPEKGKIAFMFSDVTEDRIQKEKLIAANKELIAVNTLRDKLFTVITNDVHEPLAILVNLSELLIDEMKNDSNDKCEIAVEIHKHVRDAFSMVDNLLEWFRMKKGVEVLISMKWELSELVQAAMQITAATAEEKNIKVISHIPKGTTVHVDKDMIELVITNLLSNAIKYTHRNGSVNITAEEDGELIIVSVKDSGVGITPEKVQLLFQDVIDNTSIGTEGERGIGVGLFICRRLIQINGGDIWVESTPGEGSNFFISIPRSK